MNLILMGPQGSGKSTQADFLAEKLGIPHISTGEIFRQSTDPRVQQLLANGQLIDDETTYGVVGKSITGLNGFIFDGFPRNLAQAQKEIFSVDKVIYIRLSDEEAIKRLMLRKREDDTQELVSERLRIYHQQTEPILDYYRQQGKLVDIDGSGTIEEVKELINKTLNG